MFGIKAIVEPRVILHEVHPKAKRMEQVFNLPPILLDHFVKDGYHVPTSDKPLSLFC